jgi:hypothetical protein
VGVPYRTLARWFRIPQTAQVEQAMRAHIEEPPRPARRSA